MAFNVRFYSFQKRINSTKTVGGSDTPVTLSCVLKDNTDIINPTLGINGGTNFNPKFYNYCWISEFNRYYFVDTWRYVLGFWECDCKIDVLATYKTIIGNKTKYVLRSASKYNRNIVDTLYPALAWQPNYYYDTATFTFSHDFDYGVYILGVVNNASSGIGAVTYYVTNSSAIRRLLALMMPTLQDWTTSFSGFTDVLYRSIYDAFSYIKSCKWFPVSYTPNTQLEIVRFGNYEMIDNNNPNNSLYARPLDDDISTWYIDSKTVYLPTGWMSLDGKYRCAPYAHIYLVCNPFGTIELNPNDFTDTREIKCYLYIDFIAGDSILKIYKVVGTTEYFITQRTAKMSIDVNLSQQTVDISGVLKGAIGAGVSIAGAAVVGGAGALVGGIVASGASIASAAESAIPSLSGSLGQTFDNAVSLEGKITLIYQSTYFAEEDNAENGKPLCENTQLNTLSGYIKCLDGDIDIAGAMKQELEQINEFLTGGFFYE